MSLFEDGERRFALAISGLAYENPFSPRRFEFERDALGGHYVDSGLFWSPELVHAGHDAPTEERPNVTLLRERSWALTVRLKKRVCSRDASEPDLALYEDLATYALFAKYEKNLYATIVESGSTPQRVDYYAAFQRDFEEHLRFDTVRLPSALEPAHLFAIFFQIRRAFHFVFRFIYGNSPVTAHLRAQVWQSAFTHDLRRYQQGLYARMRDIPTLVIGESGTGKDLVAQAIGRSRYIPFSPKTHKFSHTHGEDFVPLSLVALAPTLIESELFGHRRGAFTGAVSDRSGWLEVPSQHGSVFLDEIGELDASLQVKLLRVLQTRTFHRIGDTVERSFRGKIIAATNADLARLMQQGRFREDLYYRLCADIVVAPPLRARLAQSPDELRSLVELLATRIAGPAISHDLAQEVTDELGARLPSDYPWPGNVRELEQCIRNILVRRRYSPPLPSRTSPATLDRALLDSQLGAEALLDRYCTLVYRETGSYTKAGRRLGLDRRTIKARVDDDLLAELGAAR